MSCRQLDGTQGDISECLKFAKVMPPITQRCQLPCQDDCQLTNWSKFSSCTADCVGVRSRKRALIGEDAAGGTLCRVFGEIVTLSWRSVCRRHRSFELEGFQLSSLLRMKLNSFV